MTDALHLSITRTYAADDPEFSGDEVEVVLEIAGKVTLRGDFYHNQIDSQIEGFRAALEHFGIEHLGVEFTEEVTYCCEEPRDFYARALLDP